MASKSLTCPSDEYVAPGRLCTWGELVRLLSVNGSPAICQENQIWLQSCVTYSNMELDLSVKNTQEKLNVRTRKQVAELVLNGYRFGSREDVKSVSQNCTNVMEFFQSLISFH